MIGVLGNGSWATALAKVLAENGHDCRWWVRRPEDAAHIRATGRNPRYLPEAPLPLDRLTISSDLSEVVVACDTLLVVTPSAYLHTSLKGLEPADFEGKTVVSSIKGLEVESRRLVSAYFREQFQVPPERFAVVSGPSHAEEVAQRSVTYLTVASTVRTQVENLAAVLRNDYIHTVPSADVEGVEYAGVLKNVYTVGAGVALGLSYGDNFLAVYVGGCLREMEAYLHTVRPDAHPDLTHSVYLGDFLTTVYSAFSRNRKLGMLVGQGLTPAQALANMQMVAEGYFATRIMVEAHRLDFPIARTVYEILYNAAAPGPAFRNLEKILR